MLIMCKKNTPIYKYTRMVLGKIKREKEIEK